MNTGDFFDDIVVDPEVQGGTPVIRGTRVPIAVLLESMAAGDEATAIATAYEVSIEQVRAALRYAAHIIRSERYVALSR